MSEEQAFAFPTTQWSGVQRAGQPNTLGRLALGELLLRYQEPLRAHLVMQRRITGDKAEDLLQSFISDRVLEKDLLNAATPQRGRFRTFLLVTMNRFVSNRLRDERRLCRNAGDTSPLEDAEHVVDPEPTPDAAFDIAWAREVLLQAAERMREACFSSGRADVWHVFEARVLGPTLQGAQPVPYDALAREFHLDSVHAASNLTVTGKRMFARSLRGVVGEYMDEDTLIDREIEELRATLAKGR